MDMALIAAEFTRSLQRHRIVRRGASKSASTLLLCSLASAECRANPVSPPRSPSSGGLSGKVFVPVLPKVIGLGKGGGKVFVPIPPKVTGISPASGPETTLVRISGDSLGGATGVAFAGISASFSINPDGTIATYPPPVLQHYSPESFPITVYFDNGETISAPEQFSLDAQPMATLAAPEYDDDQVALGWFWKPAVDRVLRRKACEHRRR